MLGIAPCLEAVTDYLLFLVRYPSFDALAWDCNRAWWAIPLALPVAIFCRKRDLWGRFGLTVVVSLVLLVPFNLQRGFPVPACEGLAALTILTSIHALFASAVLYFLPRRPWRTLAAFVVFLVGVLVLTPIMRWPQWGFYYVMTYVKLKKDLRLYDLVLEGNIALAAELLDAGADRNATKMGEPMALNALIGLGDPVNMLRFLTARGVDLHDEWEGRNVLMEALQNGQIGPVRFLLEAGLNPNRTDGEGRTALHYLQPDSPIKETSDDILSAILLRWLYWHYGKGHAASLARLLLAHGADPDRRDAAGESPAERLRRLGLPEVAAILETPPAKAGVQLFPSHFNEFRRSPE